MFPSRSGITAGAIHEGENILRYGDIKPGLQWWELANTAAMLPDIAKS